LPVVLFHPIAGRWGPACLRAAAVSVETVSPPLEPPEYHSARSGCKIAGEALRASRLAKGEAGSGWNTILVVTADDDALKALDRHDGLSIVRLSA
jgi:hypothetical protein